MENYEKLISKIGNRKIFFESSLYRPLSTLFFLPQQLFYLYILSGRELKEDEEEELISFCDFRFRNEGIKISCLSNGNFKIFPLFKRYVEHCLKTWSEEKKLNIWKFFYDSCDNADMVIFAIEHDIFSVEDTECIANFFNGSKENVEKITKYFIEKYGPDFSCHANHYRVDEVCVFSNSYDNKRTALVFKMRREAETEKKKHYRTAVEIKGFDWLLPVADFD